MAYRNYLCDSLFAYGENKRLTQRLYDILKPQEIDDRTADEIAIDIIDRLGLKVE